MRRFRTREEEIEAIRQEPAFQALVDDLKRQTPEQLERLQRYLEEREGDHGTETTRTDSE
jgi:hypothetical protein